LKTLVSKVSEAWSQYKQRLSKVFIVCCTLAIPSIFYSATSAQLSIDTARKDLSSSQSTIRNKKIQFSSAYSTLNAANCKLLKTKSSQQIEPPQICKGFKDYKILISHQGVVTKIFIGRALSNQLEEWDLSVLPAFIANSISRGADYRRVVEWRLADGKPFAAIVRAQYDRKIIEPNGSGRVNEIVAKNLNGFRSIDVVVNASSTRNANQEARRFTDSALISNHNR
jgi:hypothetical protein